jgi:RimJ/RimL family protein N-acetyltransferase
MVGSIWASINRTANPAITRKHIRLLPNEALIHDIVTSEQSKGQGIGPFMVSSIISVLFSEYQVGRIIIDVNRNNRASLRMMEKVGLKAKEQAFYISILGRLAFEKTLWQDRTAC